MISWGGKKGCRGSNTQGRDGSNDHPVWTCVRRCIRTDHDQGAATVCHAGGKLASQGEKVLSPLIDAVLPKLYLDGNPATVGGLHHCIHLQALVVSIETYRSSVGLSVDAKVVDYLGFEQEPQQLDLRPQ